MKRNNLIALIVIILTLTLFMSYIFLFKKDQSSDERDLQGNSTFPVSDTVDNDISQNNHPQFEYTPPQALDFDKAVGSKVSIEGLRQKVLINDFRNNQTVKLFDEVGGSYYLGTNNSEFEIIFAGFDQSFQISLKQEPYGDALTQSTEYLKNLLGLDSNLALCELKISVSQPIVTGGSDAYSSYNLPYCS